MKKSLTLTGVLLSVFLLTSAACAQLADWEKRVYYDYLDTAYFSSKKSDDVYSELASRHNITVDTVKTILDKALDQQPTDWEWQVFDDLDKRLANLPQGSSTETRKKVFQEVAAQYGITLTELLSIDDRCGMLGWFW